MKRNLLPLILIVFAATAVAAGEYVKVSHERRDLLGQLRQAAEVVSEAPSDSAESRAALERGTLIAMGWPCHWWENKETVRLETEQLFTAMIVLREEKEDGVIKSMKLPSETDMR